MINSDAVRLSRNAREFSADVRVDAARSLELLRAIDSTVDWLSRVRAKLDIDIVFARATVDRVNALSPVATLDDEGVTCAALEEGQEMIRELHDLFVAKRKSARRDPNLREDDGVVEAYDAAVDSAADLHDALETLRQCILEHDADCSRATCRTYAASDLSQMFADLRAS